MFCNYNGVNNHFKPIEFCVNLHENYNSGECQKVEIIDYRFPKEFGEIYEEMFSKNGH